MFPIMACHELPGSPGAIPWRWLAPMEVWAQKNHHQSLQRLAERGGLSACEAMAVLEGREWLKDDDAGHKLKKMLDADTFQAEVKKAVEAHAAHIKEFLEELAEYLGLEGTLAPADYLKAAADIREKMAKQGTDIAELTTGLKHARLALNGAADEGIRDVGARRFEIWKAKRDGFSDEQLVKLFGAAHIASYYRYEGIGQT